MSALEEPDRRRPTRVGDLAVGMTVVDIVRTRTCTFQGPAEIKAISPRTRNGRETGALRITFTDGKRHEWHEDRTAYVDEAAPRDTTGWYVLDESQDPNPDR